MPFKDLEKRREAGRRSQAKRRANPTVRERQRTYDAARRADPAHKLWKRQYDATYLPIYFPVYYRTHRADYNARTQARRAAQKLRVPAWADLSAIAELYRAAARETVVTGIKHEVDRYYPLQGKTVSGLHVALNLRVVPQHINRVKINKHPDSNT